MAPPLDLAPYIDHALLHPSLSLQQIEEGCAEADRYHFATVCVHPCFVEKAVEWLHLRTPKVCTVIGFPLGLNHPQTKLYEAQLATDQGARELDVLINLAALRAGDLDAVHREMASIVDATGVTVKAILETSVLTDDQKQQAADVCMEAGVQFLKTSSGWQGGATVADVRVLHRQSAGRVGIKASGGIRTIEQALTLIEAGATRLGTSRGVDLLMGLAELSH